MKTRKKKRRNGKKRSVVQVVAVDDHEAVQEEVIAGVVFSSFLVDRLRERLGVPRFVGEAHIRDYEGPDDDEKD
eukprot:1384501-Amorphochlora_amoeboformis.AAC.1